MELLRKWQPRTSYGASDNLAAALVCPPAFTVMHNDHILCGQVLFHYYGRKVSGNYFCVSCLIK